MKKGMVVLGLLLFGMLLVSCGGGGQALTKEALVGTWKAAGQMAAPSAETWVFSADGTVVMTQSGTTHQGTYTLSGSTLEVKFQDLPEPIKWGVSLSAQKGLTIKKGRSSRDWFDYLKEK